MKIAPLGEVLSWPIKHACTTAMIAGLGLILGLLAVSSHLWGGEGNGNSKEKKKVTRPPCSLSPQQSRNKPCPPKPTNEVPLPQVKDKKDEVFFVGKDWANIFAGSSAPMARISEKGDCPPGEVREEPVRMKVGNEVEHQAKFTAPTKGNGLRTQSNVLLRGYRRKVMGAEELINRDLASWQAPLD